MYKESKYRYIDMITLEKKIWLEIILTIERRYKDYNKTKLKRRGVQNLNLHSLLPYRIKPRFLFSLFISLCILTYDQSFFHCH